MTPLRTLVTGGSGFIGSHVVHQLRDAGYEVLSLEGSSLGMRLDVLQRDRVREVIVDYAPRAIVHLAARTGFVERDDPEGYEINTQGTRNVLDAASAVAGRVRLVLASTNVVDHADVLGEEPGGEPRLRYAESKLAAEKILAEEAGDRVDGCVIRPCYVWGPRVGSPFREFFVRIADGRYYNPGRVDPPRLMGYVENVAYQIRRLLEAPAETIRGATFYLADYRPTTIRTWAAQIAAALGRRPPRTIPEPLVRLIAGAGDLAERVGGKRMPLTTSRLRNMRRDNTGIPIEATRRIAPDLPCTLEQGVERTVLWLREAGLVR